jgi:Mg-chelatase subunit ChlD
MVWQMLKCWRAARCTDPKSRQRQGVIVVLSALFMILMVGMLAFSIDVGYIVTLRTEAQRAVDAGALAGAAWLGDDSSVAVQVARDYAQKNKVGSGPVLDSGLNVEVGIWNETSRTFVPTTESPTAIRVFGRQVDQPLFFGRVFRRERFDVAAEAVATYRPRDIMVVLDYSASMNDDSELKMISQIGRAEIEANLREIYGELGAPVFGNMQWQPVNIAGTNAFIQQQLALNSVPYPYPAGSWNDYINYVKTAGSVSSAGYRNRYGYLTLVNYWLESKPMFAETPDLWRTSEQPITAVKDGVSVFLAYMQEAKTDDHVGLAVYTATDGTATLESALTNDFQLIEDISRQRQAGHYDPYTNIGAGMEKARVELEQNGRPGALRMIVLMTDGVGNRPSNETVARQYVLDEAQLAADAGFPIVTISLGAGADEGIMQEVADLTGGVHFNIPGGQGVDSYEEELKDVFRKIADHRPLKLVK